MKLQCPDDMVCLRMKFHEKKAIVMTIYNVVYLVGKNHLWMYVYTRTHARTHTHRHRQREGV